MKRDMGQRGDGTLLPKGPSNFIPRTLEVNRENTEISERL